MHETDATLSALKQIERKLLWLSCWTIHNANHLRDTGDGVKVGGHQASCASMVSLMTALYFNELRPEDRIAVKPHASPVFHAIQYLMGNQTRANLENFRGVGGAQSYPSRTKDVDDVDFSTGSVGLGVAATAFASLVQDYVDAKPWSNVTRKGRMVALVGDAEMDEGNVYECLQEGWKHDLRNTWWIVDYNRQSLDGIVREGLYDRLEDVFRAFGWDVITFKHGALQRAAFEQPGGERLREWIDNCPNQLYSALSYQGGAAWRARLMDEIGDQGPVTALIDRYSDAELAELMSGLGGHCLKTLTEGFAQIDHDRPTLFIAYTVKGWGTPLAGHKDNHAGLMTPAQMEEFRQDHSIGSNREWEPFEGLTLPPEDLQAFLDSRPFFETPNRRHSAAPIQVGDVTSPTDKVASTQAGFGKILDAIAQTDSPLAQRIVTTSPDVTVSTNLGPWVNRRHLFARQPENDTFRVERVPSMQKWRFDPDGQHIELGIAEMNLFLMLGAAGLSHSLFGERLLPIGTLYDPFISRGLDALNYACYQDARFMLTATPSGVTLAGEGGAHQSIASPLIGMSQDGLISFEPAFNDELAAMMQWGFNHMQDDVHGGSVYLRLSTKPLEQPDRDFSGDLQENALRGAYWMREPGPNCEIVIAYQGVVADQAIAAAGLIGSEHRDIGLLAVTSADRLHQDWQQNLSTPDRSHIQSLFRRLPRHTALITVIDGHPATLSWLGSIAGHRTHALGVSKFGQTGTVADLYRINKIDTQAIVAEAENALRCLRTFGAAA